jgi:26S proteasome regulatory subunit N10
MVRLAKKMKKTNISVDIIVFGEPDSETIHKLRQFNEAVKSNEGCFFEVIPPGPNLLSDTLLGTSLLANEGVGVMNLEGTSGGEAAAGTGGSFQFGVNPEDDPELALALRLSYEEHKAQEEAAAKQKEVAEREKLEGIPEEGDERVPLLSTEAEGGSTSRDREEGEQKKAEDKGKDKDTMDTS